MQLITQDLETFADPHSDTGGPEYNLGTTYSRSATFSTPGEDYKFITYILSAYVNGYVSYGTHTEDIQSNEDLSAIYRRVSDYNQAREDTDTHALVRLTEHLQTEIIQHNDPNPYEDQFDQDYDLTYEDIGIYWQDSLEDAEEVCKEYIDGIDFPGCFVWPEKGNPLPA